MTTLQMQGRNLRISLASVLAVQIQFTQVESRTILQGSKSLERGSPRVQSPRQYTLHTIAAVFPDVGS